MRQTLSSEISLFVCSGSHVVQKDCHPSAISTFVESVLRCGSPAIPIRPSLVKYIAKSHNLWHRALLMLEQTASDSGFLNRSRLSAQQPLPGFSDPNGSGATQQVLRRLCFNISQANGSAIQTNNELQTWY